MKNIFEYKDYRDYMRDYYAHRKQTGQFSWQKFSNIAGFSSPIYMKLVCEGKTRLSNVRKRQVGNSIGLSGAELEYFEQMVVFVNSSKDSVKKKALLKMEKLAFEQKARVVDADAFEFYESWVNPVVRELAPMMPGALPKEMAAACYENISAERIRKSLLFLLRTNFLKKVDDNVYEQTEQNVVGSKESLPIALRSMHKLMAAYALGAVEKYSPDQRHFLGVTLGCDDVTYAKVVEEMELCQKKIIAIANECKEPNKVYRLNLQLFPFASTGKTTMEA